MIKEIKIQGKDPIAYTDFSAIYLSNVLIGGDYEVARKHELSHIWLQHQNRQEIFIENNKNVEMHLLNIALDYEIAKHIYTDNDDAVITTPRSFLAGGITKKMAKKIKSKYAEEIYFELQKKGIKSKNFDKHIFSNKKSRKKEKLNIEEIVKKARKEAQKDEKKIEKIKKGEQLKKDIKSFKAPKPSLSSTIDAIFGRNKLTRCRSYRRPSRIEYGNEFFIKGMKNIKKIPRLTIYIDRSGSFSSDKTSNATAKLKEIVKKYRGEIKQDSIYFNNNLFFVDTGVGEGGTNYGAVMNHIEDNKSELSVIITDDDGAKNNGEKIEKSKIIVIPIGCDKTDLAQKYNLTEVKN